MYTPLYIKTNNNILSSIIKIDELIKFALDNNLKSLTITDSNMYGAYDFYKECTKNNIKPIIGLEVSIPDKIVLYAKNYEGYKNLIKLYCKIMIISRHFCKIKNFLPKNL